MKNEGFLVRQKKRTTPEEVRNTRIFNPQLTPPGTSLVFFLSLKASWLSSLGEAVGWLKVLRSKKPSADKKIYDHMRREQGFTRVQPQKIWCLSLGVSSSIFEMSRIEVLQCVSAMRPWQWRNRRSQTLSSASNDQGLLPAI